MPCILALLALITPRLVMFLLWLFTTWFGRAFGGQWLIPLLGFIFFPYTTLWYSVVVNWYGGAFGLFQILFLIVALLLDISSWGGGTRVYRRRRRVIVA